MARVAVTHPTWGTLRMDRPGGACFWSNLDTMAESGVCLFDAEADARAHLVTLAANPGPDACKYIQFPSPAERRPAARLAALEAAVEDVRPHARAWIGLLEAHVASLPPDRSPSGSDGDEGSSARSHAEHELRAMRRDLAALLAI